MRNQMKQKVMKKAQPSPNCHVFLCVSSLHGSHQTIQMFTNVTSYICIRHPLKYLYNTVITPKKYNSHFFPCDGMSH